MHNVAKTGFATYSSINRLHICMADGNIFWSTFCSPYWKYYLIWIELQCNFIEVTLNELYHNTLALFFTWLFSMRLHQSYDAVYIAIFICTIKVIWHCKIYSTNGNIIDYWDTTHGLDIEIQYNRWVHRNEVDAIQEFAYTLQWCLRLQIIILVLRYIHFNSFKEFLTNFYSNSTIRYPKLI